jgi:hypothetical protein
LSSRRRMSGASTSIVARGACCADDLAPHVEFMNLLVRR